jgi:hypothetical protein
MNKDVLQYVRHNIVLRGRPATMRVFNLVVYTTFMYHTVRTVAL